MAEYRAILAVANGATSIVVTHNLGSTSAVLTAATTKGWPGRPYITAQDNNTITVTFGNAAPATGALSLHTEVKV